MGERCGRTKAASFSDARTRPCYLFFAVRAVRRLGHGLRDTYSPPAGLSASTRLSRPRNHREAAYRLQPAAAHSLPSLSRLHPLLALPGLSGVLSAAEGAGQEE